MNLLHSTSQLTTSFSVIFLPVSYRPLWYRMKKINKTRFAALFCFPSDFVFVVHSSSRAVIDHYWRDTVLSKPIVNKFSNKLSFSLRCIFKEFLQIFLSIDFHVEKRNCVWNLFFFFLPFICMHQLIKLKKMMEMRCYTSWRKFQLPHMNRY
jgi:hypothetical protein